MGDLASACGLCRPGRAAVILKRWLKMRTLMPSEEMLQVRTFLTQSRFRVVRQKSIPAKICQVILLSSKRKEKSQGFVGGVTFAKRL